MLDGRLVPFQAIPAGEPPLLGRVGASRYVTPPGLAMLVTVLRKGRVAVEDDEVAFLVDAPLCAVESLGTRIVALAPLTQGLHVDVGEEVLVRVVRVVGPVTHVGLQLKVTVREQLAGLEGPLIAIARHRHGLCRHGGITEGRDGGGEEARGGCRHGRLWPPRGANLVGELEAHVPDFTKARDVDVDASHVGQV